MSLEAGTNVEWIGPKDGALVPGAQGRVVEVTSSVALVKWDDPDIQIAMRYKRLPTKHLRPFHRKAKARVITDDAAGRPRIRAIAAVALLLLLAACWPGYFAVKGYRLAELMAGEGTPVRGSLADGVTFSGDGAAIPGDCHGWKSHCYGLGVQIYDAVNRE